jgi:hypothetical protein
MTEQRVAILGFHKIGAPPPYRERIAMGPNTNLLAELGGES